LQVELLNHTLNKHNAIDVVCHSTVEDFNKDKYVYTTKRLTLVTPAKKRCAVQAMLMATSLSKGGPSMMLL